jgi:hypothetical protein
MTESNSDNGIDQFQDPDMLSGQIFSSWLHRSGVERKLILEELDKFSHNIGDIGEKTFKQWTSNGESAKRVSGSSPELRGDRLIALVKWFTREHLHRSRPVMSTAELRQLMSVYPDLPIKNRLQLKRVLHDLEILSGEREANFSFATDWKNHFADWPVFCFVIDSYWTIRATTCYEMALAGYHEDDMKQWSWWHRLLATRKGKTKYQPDSPRYSLRGPYADVYYCQQLERFHSSTQSFSKDDQRFAALLKLLMATPRFADMWERATCTKEMTDSQFTGIPVPFFRDDGTLLWMLEVSTQIPNTADYHLIVWVPLNSDSAEYQAEIRRWADESGNFSRKAYYIEDFKQYFGEKECFALGVE